MKRAQAEYAWIFSLIIGAMIIFLALYAATKIFSTGTYLTDTEIRNSFDIILNPFASLGGIATLSLSKEITLPYETEMNLTCNDAKEEQMLSLRTLSGKTFGEWTSQYSIKNKYVFSSQIIKGKKFWTFSKPFMLPWRVDDMIYIVSDNYCFIDSNNLPGNIRTELSLINASSISIVPFASDCGNAITVCFSGTCNISVDYNSHFLRKSGQTAPIYFLDDASMYAAIFSDKQIYGCNMKRLLLRASAQSDILIKEANILDCAYPVLKKNLEKFRDSVKQASSQTLSTDIVLALISNANILKNDDNINCPIINK
jgi:hypothetical protein